MTVEQEAAPGAAETETETLPQTDAQQDEQQPQTPEPVEEDSDRIWAEIQAEKAGETPATPDPAPNADPALAAQLEAEQERKQKFLEKAHNAADPKDRERLEQSVRSSAGRIAALQKKLSAARDEPGRDTPSARDAIAGIRDDYPEIAKPIEDALGAIEGKLERFTKAETSAREADQVELNTLVEAETNRLLAKHGDYADVLSKNGRAFQQWIDDQPRAIRDAAHRNASFIADAEGAIQVIDGFKRHLGLVADDPPVPQPTLSDKRKRQINALSTPARSGGRPTVSGIPPEGDPQAIWDAIQAEKARKR